MYTTNVLRQAAPYLISAVNKFLSKHSEVSEWLVKEGSSDNTNIIIWFKHRNYGSLIAYQVFIGNGGDFFSPNDELYPIVTVWLSEVLSRVRQQERANHIRAELIQRIPLKFEEVEIF